MTLLVDFKHKALIDSKSGDKAFPTCFDELMDYHAYLLNSKHPNEAQRILKRVFEGELVITNMHLEMENQRKLR